MYVIYVHFRTWSINFLSTRPRCLATLGNSVPPGLGAPGNPVDIPDLNVLESRPNKNLVTHVFQNSRSSKSWTDRYVSCANHVQYLSKVMNFHSYMLSFSISAHHPTWRLLDNLEGFLNVETPPSDTTSSSLKSPFTNLSTESKICWCSEGATFKPNLVSWSHGAVGLVKKWPTLWKVWKHILVEGSGMLWVNSHYYWKILLPSYQQFEKAKVYIQP